MSLCFRLDKPNEPTWSALVTGRKDICYISSVKVKRGSVVSYISHATRLQCKEETHRDLVKGDGVLGIPQEGFF